MNTSILNTALYSSLLNDLSVPSWTEHTHLSRLDTVSRHEGLKAHGQRGYFR